jgi:hypothetical protein
MKPQSKLSLFVVMIVAIGSGTRPSFAAQADQAKPATGSQERGVLIVELSKPLNSKNLKPGSAVEARVHVRQNGMSIPTGSKVIGHITESSARSKGDSESSLKIVFDTINPPGAKPTSISGLVKAVAPNPDPGPDTGADIGGYSIKEATEKSAGISPRSSSTPLLNAQSTGVLGIKNLELKDGTLTSGGKEVKLESGTQLLLNVTVNP